ncbi:MAG: hypothetical protein FJ406_03065 [Verrucomicrobia bacterium]|nr:hypothetical protein [Verrucomicrobiota bacterium]MBM3871862.1 hypothetical protein [Verrucomicrobiota bacterium]
MSRTVSFLCSGTMLALLALPTGAARAPKPAAPSPERVESAVQAGSAFLVSQQQATGAIADAARLQTALTSLAGLALLGAGHSPLNKSPEGVALRRAILFVLRTDRQTADGYFGAADASVMYGHAVTTLFLCELLWRSADPEQEELIRRKAAAGCNFILGAQGAAKSTRRDTGGWRYKPDARDSDMSVTAWQLLALHAGVKADFSMSPRNGQAAAQYLKNAFAAEHGVFAYQVRAKPTADDKPLQPEGRHKYFSTTAMGLLGLRICGQSRAPETAVATNFLLNELRFDPPGDDKAPSTWMFHRLFFSTLALNNFTEAQVSLAGQAAERNFVGGQAADGSWNSGYEGRNIGRVYCTSLALLSLEAKHQRLAIFTVP